MKRGYSRLQLENQLKFQKMNYSLAAKGLNGIYLMREYATMLFIYWIQIFTNSLSTARILMLKIHQNTSDLNIDR